MRKGIIVLVMLLIVNGNSIATDLHIKEKNGTLVVYTSVTPFFKRAFRLAKPANRTLIMEMIRKEATKMGLDPKLALSIARIESDFNPDSVSSSGAVGVMQLMKKTALYYGVRDRNNIEENIKGGLKFLKHLTKKYHDVRLVAAAYNAGETIVDKYGGVPPIKQTQRYVRKFLAAYNGRMVSQKTVKRRIVKRPIVLRNGTYTNIGSLW